MDRELIIATLTEEYGRAPTEAEIESEYRSRIEVLEAMADEADAQLKEDLDNYNNERMKGIYHEFN